MASEFSPTRGLGLRAAKRETYWLQDGFHRLKAAQRLGCNEIRVEVKPGNYSDMQAEWQEYLRSLKADLNEWAATHRRK
jgi:ParB-like chromosome segregation protein Spo0J